MLAALDTEIRNINNARDSEEQVHYSLFLDATENVAPVRANILYVAGGVKVVITPSPKANFVSWEMFSVKMESPDYTLTETGFLTNSEDIKLFAERLVNTVFPVPVSIY